MFSLLSSSIRLDHVNPRMEKHGDEHVPAADLKLTIRASNDVLAEFDPNLKGAFYTRPDTPDLADEPNHLPKLRFPLMGKLKWAKEFVGYNLTWHAGVDERSDILLDLVDLDRFAFVCMEGGTVEVSFRAKCKPEPSVLGRLCAVMQGDISVSLVPSESASEVDGNGEED